MMDFENALYLALHGDATLLALATGGVWREQAAQGTACPYVLIQCLSPAIGIQTFSGTPCEQALYLVKGVVDTGNTGGIQQVSYDIDARIHTLVENAALSLANGKTLMFLRRERRHSLAEFDPTGRRFHNRGGIYRVWASV